MFTYHISSGGYGEQFVRGKNGRYRSVGDEIWEGKIEGLDEIEYWHIPFKNVNREVRLGKSPLRLLLEVGDVLELTYSLEEQRVTGWSRFLMAVSRQSPESDYSLLLSLRELSGQRGIALVANLSTDTGIEETMLVEFPWQDLGISKEFKYKTLENTSARRVDTGKMGSFKLKKSFGKDGVIELNASKLSPGQLGVSVDDEDLPISWKIELSGNGKEFNALDARLKTLREKYPDGLPDSQVWPAPTTMILDEPFGQNPSY